MEVIQAFGCSFCGMTSRHKSSVIRHESKYCKKSTNRRTCLNCTHWFDNGVDHNGMDEPYRQEWIDAGCGNESLKFNCEEEDLIYSNRNDNNDDCKEFKYK